MACLVAAAPLCISRQRASYSSLEHDEDAATADGFFDMICKYQSQRLDEQRAFLPSRTGQTPRRVVSSPITKKTPEDDKLLEMLWSVQHSRLNEQRCEMPSAPHLVSRISRQGSQQQNDEESEEASSSEEEEEEEVAEEEVVEEAEEKRDHLHDLLVHAQGPPRLNEQHGQAPSPSGRRRSTMPSEDFFNLIQHLQSTRIEDQRSPLPVLAN